MALVDEQSTWPSTTRKDTYGPDDTKEVGRGGGGGVGGVGAVQEAGEGFYGIVFFC